ncbi:BZ3500_MvSof-1268-A1-R1_Chr1-1g01133 [Microbotryum saponariae]|uniref:BZ3500_MvSof-1268-A1-R1_Chr1-1g01133 protein n=1 Tax=Microbotryum saponariae TaxID=289078 RepID=A0A2X0MNM7_9BASI|nr:BZ3500_MvSof-1268-A1-R1_Chr1-1g01133 [Microbotryum saponariae]SCZ93465.1 BZ3501_MvSof-1269-A2-R1_Chr1-1g00730 [Microbotryum saponariae]
MVTSPAPTRSHYLPTLLPPLSLLPPFPINAQANRRSTSTRSNRATSASTSKSGSPTPDLLPRSTDVMMTCIDGRARLLFRHTADAKGAIAPVPLDSAETTTARDLIEPHEPINRVSWSSHSRTTTEPSTRSSSCSRSTTASGDEHDQITPRKRTDLHPDDAGLDLSSDPTYFSPTSPSPHSRIGKKARVARCISESLVGGEEAKKTLHLDSRKPKIGNPFPSTNKTLSDLSFLLYHSDRLPEAWLTMLDVLVEEGKMHLQAAEREEERRGVEDGLGVRTL